MTWSVNKYLVNGKPTFFLSFSFFLWFFFSLLLSSFFSLKREKRKERVMVASSYKIFSLSLSSFLFLSNFLSFVDTITSDGEWSQSRKKRMLSTASTDREKEKEKMIHPPTSWFLPDGSYMIPKIIILIKFFLPSHQRVRKKERKEADRKRKKKKKEGKKEKERFFLCWLVHDTLVVTNH